MFKEKWHFFRGDPSVFLNAGVWESKVPRKWVEMEIEGPSYLRPEKRHSTNFKKESNFKVKSHPRSLLSILHFIYHV